MALVVLLAVCIEVFGFNLAFFTSWLYPDEGAYLVNGSDPAAVGELTLDAGSNSFEITGLDSTIDNIHFSPTILNEDVLEVADDTIQVVMYLQDEGNGTITRFQPSWSTRIVLRVRISALSRRETAILFA